MVSGSVWILKETRNFRKSLINLSKLKRKKIISPWRNWLYRTPFIEEVYKRKLYTTSISTSKPTALRRVKKVKYLICDIRKFNDLKKKLKSNFDYVVNLSGYIEHTNKNSIIKTHLQGCKNIVNIFKNRNIKSFIQMGTCLEYGNLKSPQKEKAKCRPQTKYAKSKLKSYYFLEKMFNKYTFLYIIEAVSSIWTQSKIR